MITASSGCRFNIASSVKCVVIPNSALIATNADLSVNPSTPKTKPKGVIVVAHWVLLAFLLYATMVLAVADSYFQLGGRTPTVL